MKHSSRFPIALLFAFFGLIGRASAESPPPGDWPFVVVFVDSKTEKASGPFPYDRAVYANAINKAADSGAKGVVLKFFIDKPKTADGDQALVDSAKRTKLIVQARLDDEEKTPNPLPDRFKLAMNPPSAGKLLSGKSGWLPLPALSAAAYDLGFIDYRTIDRMPLVERYQDVLVRSLYLCCLEFAYGERAEISPGKSIRLHGKTATLNEQGEVTVEYPAKDDLTSISFADFIQQPARPEVKDKIVIVAYDSERFEAVDTPMGKVRPHRAFVYALMSIYRKFR